MMTRAAQSDRDIVATWLTQLSDLTRPGSEPVRFATLLDYASALLTAFPASVFDDEALHVVALETEYFPVPARIKAIMEPRFGRAARMRAAEPLLRDAGLTIEDAAWVQMFRNERASGASTATLRRTLEMMRNGHPSAFAIVETEAAPLLKVEEPEVMAPSRRVIAAVRDAGRQVSTWRGPQAPIRSVAQQLDGIDEKAPIPAAARESEISAAPQGEKGGKRTGNHGKQRFPTAPNAAQPSRAIGASG